MTYIWALPSNISRLHSQLLLHDTDFHRGFRSKYVGPYRCSCVDGGVEIGGPHLLSESATQHDREALSLQHHMAEQRIEAATEDQCCKLFFI